MLHFLLSLPEPPEMCFDSPCENIEGLYKVKLKKVWNTVKAVGLESLFLGLVSSAPGSHQDSHVSVLSSLGRTPVSKILGYYTQNKHKISKEVKWAKSLKMCFYFIDSRFQMEEKPVGQEHKHNQ